ncbi:hypothetical protein O181_037538 [Austropuccinia psidii MF-1]|uniref:Uncharacterized protein n=1 Tax=Austropuccinia psidii MF-1 TaxID=1389203 RepID=A0A9Q3D9M3_9BASI|nr:hypothetical protein [Austropuccinia psidii MF-1]
MGARKYNLLINTGALIQCTSILGAAAIRKEDSLRFQQAYDMYQKTSKFRFRNLPVKPNHHYAMHYPDQLRWWGPMMGGSQFSGEQLVGICQELKINGLNGMMEESIMNKFGQMQRMEEHWTQEKEKGDSQNHKEEKRHSQNHKELDDKTYMELLDYLRGGNPG